MRRLAELADRPALVALIYLLALLGGRSVVILQRTFEHGLGPVWTALTQPDALHALKVTLEVAASRRGPQHRLRCRRLAPDRAPPLPGTAAVRRADRPAGGGVARGRGPRADPRLRQVQPVGGWLENHGIQIIFSVPGMVIATVFISLPLVVRAVAPVLEEIGDEQEQAARTLGAPRCRLPADHAAVDQRRARLRRRAVPGSSDR